MEKLEVRAQCPSLGDQEERTLLRSSRLDGQERGSLLSLTEEEQEGEQVCVCVCGQASVRTHRIHTDWG